MHTPGGGTYLETLHEELEMLREMRMLPTALGRAFCFNAAKSLRTKPCRRSMTQIWRRFHRLEKGRGDFYKLRNSYFSCSLQDRLAELKRLESHTRLPDRAG